jgi:hypothetical protein
MKTLVIRRGSRHIIRAIANEADDGGRDRCETLAFFEEQSRTWLAEVLKLGAILTDTSENGVPHDERKFKKLKGTDGLHEFKSPDGLRLFCFWDDCGLIICTHGYVKDADKAPKHELRRADRIKREYFAAKKLGQLHHVEPARKPPRRV